MSQEVENRLGLAVIYLYERARLSEYGLTPDCVDAFVMLAHSIKAKTMTPAETISSLEHDLGEYAQYLDTSFDAIRRKVDDSMKRGGSIADFEIDRIMEVAQGDTVAALEVAVAYWLLADELLSTQGLEAAWPAMAKAERNAGRVEPLIAALSDGGGGPGRLASISKVSSMGGKGRGRIADDARARAVVLLADKKPEGGWTRPGKAVAIIAPILAKEFPGSKVSSNFPAAVREWIRKVEPVRKAYQANAAPPKPEG